MSQRWIWRPFRRSRSLRVNSTCSMCSASAKWRSASAAIRRKKTGSCTPSGRSAPSAARSRGCGEMRSSECGARMAPAGPSRRPRAAMLCSSPVGSASHHCVPQYMACLPGASFYGRVVLLYGARGPSDILYRRELETWRRRLDVDIEVTVDHAGPDWRSNVGVVPGLIPRIPFDPHHAVALICGPEIMMRFTIAALRDRGLASEQIYLSMERNMKCAVGLCGRCQFGPAFVCLDGPVFRFDRIAPVFGIREI